MNLGVLVSKMTAASEIVDEELGVVLNSFEINNWIQAVKAMPSKTFEIPTDFAFQKQLTVSQHIEKMMVAIG